MYIIIYKEAGVNMNWIWDSAFNGITEAVARGVSLKKLAIKLDVEVHYWG